MVEDFRPSEQPEAWLDAASKSFFESTSPREVAEASSQSPEVQAEADRILAQARKKNEEILNQRNAAHTEAQRSILERRTQSQVELEKQLELRQEYENGKMWFDFGTDLNETIEEHKRSCDQVIRQCEEAIAAYDQVLHHLRKSSVYQKRWEALLWSERYEEAQHFFNMAAHYSRIGLEASDFVYQMDYQTSMNILQEAEAWWDETVQQAEVAMERASMVRDTVIVVGAVAAVPVSGGGSLGILAAAWVWWMAMTAGQIVEQWGEMVINGKSLNEAIWDGSYEVAKATAYSALAGLAVVAAPALVPWAASWWSLATAWVGVFMAKWGIESGLQNIARRTGDVGIASTEFMSAYGDEISNMDLGEVASLYMLHMEWEGLSPGEVMTEFVVDVSFWSISGWFSSRIEPLEAWLKKLLADTGVSVGELITKESLGVMSAYITDAIEGWSVDEPEDVIYEQLLATSQWWAMVS